MTNLKKTAIFGYVGCKGREFFENGAGVGRQRLQALADKLAYDVITVTHVEQQSYRRHAVKDVLGLISRARTYCAENPENSLIFCFDNQKLVCSYLPLEALAEMRKLGRILDSQDLEKAVFALEDACLRAGAFNFEFPT